LETHDRPRAREDGPLLENPVRIVRAFFGTTKRHMEEAEIEEKAHTLLEMMGIRHLSDQVVLNLPYGAREGRDGPGAGNATKDFVVG